MKQFLKYVSFLTALTTTGLGFTYASQALASEQNLSVALNQLKAYQLKFTTIEQVQSYSVGRALGEVTHKLGENFATALPFDVQQIKFLVSNGQSVKTGQKVAQVFGLDVHHFLDEVEAARALYQLALDQYQTNKKLYQRKAIKQSVWLEVSKNYFEAKLRAEHIEHAMSVLIVEQNELYEQVYLKAAKSGVVEFNERLNSGTAGQSVFDVVEADGLVLSVKLPSQFIEQLVGLSLPDAKCQLRVDVIEATVSDFMQHVWSEPILSSCSLTLGQQTLVKPNYQLDGYQAPKSAVFEVENVNYIAIKQGDRLTAVPIVLVGSTAGDFVFTASENLANRQVLASSVSAFQGVLLALGTE